jgi:hypothetical protein
MLKPILFSLLVLGASMLGARTADVSVEPLSLGDLDPYFKSIHAQDGGLAFLRNPESRPLVCQIGGLPAFVSRPGGSFVVRWGSHFRLYDKHCEIKFLTDRGLIDKGLRDSALFFVEEASAHGSTDLPQTIHVGYIGLSPYFTGQMPSERKVEVFHWRNIATLSDLLAVQKECGDVTPPVVNEL